MSKEPASCDSALKVRVPPIKSQGIKTKLVPWIVEHVPKSLNRWIEPFMGTGVVGFNVAPDRALFSDLNPHTIHFYKSLQTNAITPYIVRHFLEENGARLAEQGEDFFYEVRARFNKEHRPLDFLFLSRACFNGMIRFNREGKFNVPFCRKPGRFGKSYITKIVNQVSWVHRLVRSHDWVFESGDFTSIIAGAGPADFIYCDPPYFQRHVDYYNSWGVEQEYKLYMVLKEAKARFLLSTWQGNEYRNNKSVENYWNKFSIHTMDHFYHVGARGNNRHAITEALVFNYQLEAERQARERVVCEEGSRHEGDRGFPLTLPPETRIREICGPP